MNEENNILKAVKKRSPMIDITFEIGGKKVNPNNVGDALQKIMLEKVKENIANRVGNIHCPVHGSAPKIICKGSDLQRLTFNISGCCDKLIETVKAKLK